jgi:serine/threonine protein kinase
MEPTLPIGIAAGTVIAERYTVEALLGRGGMASVYSAVDEPLGRRVALKVFEIDAQATAGLGRESSEIRLLASLNHHALVTLFDASVEGAEYSFLVMELVEGPTLKERIERGPIAEVDVAQLLVDLAEALHVVHGSGVVHRDVKPANILLHSSALAAIEFRAKLSDFGIAYLIDSTRLTMPGTIIGTAAYLSPEQARGVAPDSAADIYSLGLVALEALTGVRAFDGTMLESLSARLVSDPVVPAELGAEWGSLLTRMTAREPAERPTALEVVEAARRIERNVYAGAGDDLTRPMSASELPVATGDVDASTAVLPAGDVESATTVLPVGEGEPATTVMPAAGGESTTTVLPAASPGSPVPTSVVRRSRAVLIGAAVLIVLVGGAFAWVAVASSGGESSEVQQQQPEPLPANEGDLGAHLDELLKSVTP